MLVLGCLDAIMRLAEHLLLGSHGLFGNCKQCRDEEGAAMVKV